MEQSIAKFIIYLQNCKKNIEDKIEETSSSKTAIKKAAELFQQHQKTVENLLNFLSEKEKNQKVYLDFETLSILLEDSELTAREKKEVVFYVLNNNIGSNQMTGESKIFFDVDSIRENYFSNVNEQAFKEVCKKIEEDALCDKKDEELNDLEKEVKHALLSWNKEKEQEILFIRNAHRNIKQHYFIKIKNYSAKDIIFIMVSLKALKLSPKLCAIIKRLLTNELEKRDRNASKIPKKTLDANLLEIKIKNKEENGIYREIKEEFDLDEETAKRPLVLEEIIYLLSLFYKAKFPQEKIKRYYKEICRVSFPLKNPMVDFIRITEQMKNYENQEIQNAINTIWEYWEQMFIASSKDYHDGQEIIKKELQDLFNKIYEEEAKTL